MFLILLASICTAVPALLVGLDIGSEYIKVAYQDESIITLPSSIGEGWPNIFKASDDKGSLELDYYYRLLGTPFNDTTVIQRLKSHYVHSDYSKDPRRDTWGIQLGEQRIEHIEVLLSYVLENVKKALEPLADGDKLQAAIVVPAYFTNAQRASIKNAVQGTGFDALQTINENSAAALCLAEDFNSKTGKIILIFNVGASTTQASVTKLDIVDKRISEVRTKKLKSVHMLSHVWRHAGLVDLDVTLAKFFAARYLELTGDKLQETDLTMRALRRLAKTTNALLESHEQTTLNFAASGLKDVSLEVTKDQVHSLYAIHCEALTSAAKEALARAGLSVSDLSGLQLIGGASRNSFIEKCIFDAIGLLSDEAADPYTLASRGAVLLAHNITSPIQNKNVSPRQILLTDVLSYDFSATLSISGLPAKSFKVFNAGSPFTSTKRVSLTHRNEAFIQISSSNFEAPFGSYKTQGIIDFNDARKSVNKTSINYYTFAVNADGGVVLEEVESRMNLTLNIKRDKEMTKAVNDYYKEKYNKTVNWTGGIVPGDVETTQQEVWNITDMEKIKAVYEETLTKSFSDNDARQIKQRFDQQLHSQKKQARIVQQLAEFERKLAALKNLLDDDSFVELLSSSEVLGFKSMIDEAASSVKDLSTAAEGVISNTLHKYRQAFQVYLDRQTEVINFKQISVDALPRLDELLAQLKKLSYTKTWVDQQIKDASLTKFQELADWILEKILQQRELVPWVTPVLTTKLLKNKLLACEKIINDLKAIPRPKKQLVVRAMQRVKTEGQESPADSTLADEAGQEESEPVTEPNRDHLEDESISESTGDNNVDNIESVIEASDLPNADQPPSVHELSDAAQVKTEL